MRVFLYIYTVYDYICILFSFVFSLSVSQYIHINLSVSLPQYVSVHLASAHVSSIYPSFYVSAQKPKREPPEWNGVGSELGDLVSIQSDTEFSKMPECNWNSERYILDPLPLDMRVVVFL